MNETTEFEGRTVLITGATSGIGRAAAAAFLARGAAVGVNHMSDSAGFQQMRELLPGGERLLELETDVRDGWLVQKMVEALVKETGRLDALICNAGISQIKPFLETTEDDWNRIIDTDLKSVFLCCRAAIPFLQRQGGAIVNIASELALSGRSHFAPYTAAKGGVISLSRSLAREFAPQIRVNVVAPGPTRTAMLEQEAAVPGHQESAADLPLQRFADPAEIAETIVFLASTRASFFCGDVVSPNGGAVMR